MERARASHFRFEVDRNRFVLRRIALRTILASYLGTAPGDITYGVNAFGKPAVDRTQACEELSFNASHSAGIALIAVTRSRPIGVDIERMQSLAEAESIAARYFTANEVAALASLDPHDRAEGFFNAWTRKEAIVKAVGGGLSIPLDSFDVSLRPKEPAEILRWDIDDDPSPLWRIYHLTPAPGFIGALAADREASVCQCGWWPI